MIAIPNMNKPKSCCECPIAKSYLDCLMEKKYVCPIGNKDGCPLIEIVQCKDCKHRDPEDKKCDCGMFERLTDIKENDMGVKLKPCPYRVHGERKMSLTIEDEYYYNEYFMPCLKEKCACYHKDCGEAYCDRNGAYMRLGELKGE